MNMGDRVVNRLSVQDYISNKIIREANHRVSNNSILDNLEVYNYATTLVKPCKVSINNLLY